jgi:hypothetical protein
MKRRIAMWASVGFLVAGFWALYYFPTARVQAEPIAWILARLTCPIVFAAFYVHFPIGVYWVLLANAATYALVGLIVETLRRKFRLAKIEPTATCGLAFVFPRLRSDGSLCLIPMRSVTPTGRLSTYSLSEDTSSRPMRHRPYNSDPSDPISGMRWSSSLLILLDLLPLSEPPNADVLPCDKGAVKMPRPVSVRVAGCGARPRGYEIKFGRSIRNSEDSPQGGRARTSYIASSREPRPKCLPRYSEARLTSVSLSNRVSRSMGHVVH